MLFIINIQILFEDINQRFYELEEARGSGFSFLAMTWNDIFE
jgi:hypothetical protein